LRSSKTGRVRSIQEVAKARRHNPAFNPESRWSRIPEPAGWSRRSWQGGPIGELTRGDRTRSAARWTRAAKPSQANATFGDLPPAADHAAASIAKNGLSFPPRDWGTARSIAGQRKTTRRDGSQPARPFHVPEPAEPPPKAGLSPTALGCTAETGLLMEGRGIRTLGPSQKARSAVGTPTDHRRDAPPKVRFATDC